MHFSHFKTQVFVWYFNLNSINYPTTREFKFRYFTPTLLTILTIWFILITMVNIVAVAYETVPFTSLQFNTTVKLWYEKFVPTFWLPTTRSCDSSLIAVGEGKREKVDSYWSLGVVTSYSGFQYNLKGYVDPSDESSENGLNYYNNPFQNCSVRTIQFIQNLWSPATDEVYPPLL